MTEYLTGDKVSLSKFTERFVTFEYLDWLNNHQVNRYLCTGRLPVTKEDVFAPKNDKDLLFAVTAIPPPEYTPTRDYIGTASLHKIDWIDRKGEVGYMVGNQDYWGKGVATEIIRLLTEYGFNRLNLNKITAGVVDGNIGSMRALEKNGFKKYGIDPQDYYLEGQYLDTHKFYKLRGSGT